MVVKNIDYNVDAWDRLDGISDPRENEQLVGHESELDFLSRKYLENSLHHAWLISGPRGIGKATFAFRFAEHLLRHPNSKGAPAKFAMVDDAVHSQVAKGAHPNVMVLRRPWDPKTKKFKTQISVEEVRKTIKFFGTSSGANAWRVCIVDPADDLNASAANALLKILEEPPAKTIFMVLAHSPRGLLPTIRSRCQSLSLKPLCDDTLTAVLKKQGVLDGMSQDEIIQLTGLAKGSVRRAILLANSKAISNFNDFIANTGKSSPDFTSLHRLAGGISIASKSDEFKLFMDLIYDHLSSEIHNPSNQVNPKKLLNLSKVWEETLISVATMEEWNMDKKQVILSLFNNMRAA